jgi:hypothetical protein
MTFFDILFIAYINQVNDTGSSKPLAKNMLQKIKILKKRVLSHKLPKLPSWL